MEFEITKGLTLPFSSELESRPQDGTTPQLVCADLSFVRGKTFRILVKPGSSVKKGQPLVQDKNCPERLFPSPAGGTVTDVIRGEKRRLLHVVIKVDEKEKEETEPSIDPTKSSKEQVIERLLKMGGFYRIRSRPFNQLAEPSQLPKSIFIKGFESAPLCMPLEKQIEGKSDLLLKGIQALETLCKKTHLVVDGNTPKPNYTQKLKKTKVIEAKGLYPKSSLSIAIDLADPVTNIKDCIWTLNIYDVVCIGSMMEGKLHTEKLVGLFSPNKKQQKFFLSREGVSITSLASSNSFKKNRYCSGSPLLGQETTPDGFLGFEDFGFCSVPKDDTRVPAHFLRLSTNHYSSFGAYLSKKLNLSTNQNGEGRAFIDGSIYQKVTPLSVSVIHLIKALLAKNYEQAVELGLLEISEEDFALPSYICPSKINMYQIVKEALLESKQELLC